MQNIMLSCFFATAICTVAHAQTTSDFIVATEEGLEMASVEKNNNAPTPAAPVYDPNAVTRMAQFPGGEASFMAFLNKHAQYPKIAKENGFEGTVMVQATVAADGSLTNIRVTGPVGPYLDDAAIKAIEAMPKWSPALQMGRAVKSKINIPVSFRLQ